MAIKTYGKIVYDKQNNRWVIQKAEPHICIRLKHIFPKIDKTATVPFILEFTEENCHDLVWFMERYTLEISPADKKILRSWSNAYTKNINELERLFLPDYKPRQVSLKEGQVAREYQLVGAELHNRLGRLLLGDDLGLGKTVTAILTMLYDGALPCVVVTPSHLTTHWQSQIAKFTNLTVHIINSTKPYSLPVADVYLTRYSCLKGWSDVNATGIFKQAILEEVQELRHYGTCKRDGAVVLLNNVQRVLALSATPIYNYGNEMFSIAELIVPGCLGTWAEFCREWAPDGKIVSNPQALGSYLREKYIMLRRSRADVGRQLPDINKLVYTVGYDSEEVRKEEERAIKLAIQTTTGTFMERGSAARELNIFVRHLTGVSKARDVAAFVGMILDSGKSVVLAGWHREVYEIWLEKLKHYNPVMYTGSESTKEKDLSVQKFTSGQSKLFIISLRSGVGLDGLQYCCDTVVYGELDPSPKVHSQVTARVDRDGQPHQVTEIYLVSDYGSDPVLIDILGLKSSQSFGILNPTDETEDQYSDETWIKKLAQQYLDKAGYTLPEKV